ncbi:uncharacterized protein LY89DRAFT_326940 [Mollisia scopiformis]|uniref:Uncharacterized protein n=1 Tax=Mollisia scopiformis TaxID=149040 RepID=A0A132B8V0_MOLSC|nr:uncharacterized protein LY89DRAFT_326940 [Mollisia scopiformis]KUJ08826.1 hypothetical protein LY89DRAFT_326940 [Mollisia scopiformis]
MLGGDKERKCECGEENCTCTKDKDEKNDKPASADTGKNEKTAVAETPVAAKGEQATLTQRKAAPPAPPAPAAK